MRKTIITAVLMMMVLSISAFAGEGSDTVGGGKLLPQLRYGYSVSTWETNDSWGFRARIIRPTATTRRSTGGSWTTSSSWRWPEASSFMMEDSTTGGLPPIVILTASEKTEWADSFMWGIGARGTFWRSDGGFYVGGGALFTHTRAADYSAAISGKYRNRAGPPHYHRG